jgi:hypothetical protein
MSPQAIDSTNRVGFAGRLAAPEAGPWRAGSEMSEAATPCRSRAWTTSLLTGNPPRPAAGEGLNSIHLGHQASYLLGGRCALPTGGLADRPHDWENASHGDQGDAVNRRLPRVSLAALMTLAAMLLSSCAPDANPVVGTGEDPAGFLMGLWHGIILPVTFVISLFTDDVSVYEVVNSGNWYDFGFILGVLMSLGGGGAGAGTKRRR